MFFVYLILFVFMLLSFLLIYSKVYFRSLTCLHVDDHSVSVCNIKPGPGFFKSFGSTCGFVHLGSNYYAFYIPSDSDSVTFSNFNISSSFYVFKRTRLGRFRSVDLSDRSINDIIKKFVF